MKKTPDHGASLEEAPESSSSARSQAGPLLFLTGMFFVNFLARIIMAPLMPLIEKDMGIGHEEAGSFFLFIYFGLCGMLLFSGFVSSRLNHRRTIILSTMAVGAALLMVSASRGLWHIRLGLFIVGAAAGLYLPSSLATITSLVRVSDWGKAIAIHELAPNLGFVSAPLLSEALLRLYPWRGVLAFLGGVSILAGAAFLRFGKGGDFPGKAPDLSTLSVLLPVRSIWIMIVMFALGIGASLGVYTMLPLYLVAQQGVERSVANTLVALSRVSGAGMALFAGWLTDRLGPKNALRYVFMATGVMTVLLGAASGSWIVPIVFLQPLAAACFFPAGFAALSLIVSPRMRNVAVSMTLPFGTLLGAGAIPAGIGAMGEAGHFALGIALVGGVVLGSIVLLNHLKFSGE